VRLYRALAQAGRLSNFGDLHFFHKAKQKNGPLPIAQSVHRLPDAFYLFAG
jgi:hypothetical protein